MWLLYNNSPQRQCQLTCLWIMQCCISMQLPSNVCLRMFGDSLSIVQLFLICSLYLLFYFPRFVDLEKLNKWSIAETSSIGHILQQHIEAFVYFKFI